MKRFLYYNQDSVNSMLAQFEQGLLVKKEAGEDSRQATSNTQGLNSNIAGDLSAKLFSIGSSVKGEITSTSADEEITETLVKRIQEKVLHDYAFDIVYNHITSNNLIKNENPEIGDYVLVNEFPTFLDFNYFQTLFADNGAVKFTNDQKRKAISEAKQNIPKGTPASAVIKEGIRQEEDQLKTSEAERKDMVQTIEAIKNTLPYNRFVMTENFLVPLDDNNFRDDPNIVAFKYGGKMSVFGYVTNVIRSEGTPPRNNDFAPLYDTVNQIMLNMFNGQDTIYIVHPVALFY